MTAKPVTGQQPIPAVENKTTNYTLFWCLLAFYALAILFGINNHEQWRDEAQAWLIVRDASFFDLFSILRTEGHPPLWYLLIMPMAKAGLPYDAQSYLAAAIMIAAVYIILFKTKLHLVVKILLPASYFFIYEYSFFARSYCMLAFFSVAIISLYEYRHTRPWLYALCVVGLFNTHVLAFTFAGSLLLIYLWEIYEKKIKDKNALGAVLLMMIGGGYLLPYLFFAKMANEFDKGITDPWAEVLEAINNGVSIGQSAALSVIIILAATVLVAVSKNLKALAVLAGGLISVFYILGFKYSTSELRHQGVIFFITLTAVFIATLSDNKQRGKMPSPLHWVMIVLLFVQLKPAFEYYINDIQNTFSGAKDAAGYLQENNLDDKIIVGHQAWAASALLPFMDEDIKMYYGECERYGTYYIYDSCFINNNWQYSVEVSVDRAYTNFKEHVDSVVFVFNYPVNEKGLMFLDLQYATPDETIRGDEAFYIYKFKEGVK